VSLAIRLLDVIVLFFVFRMISSIIVVPLCPDKVYVQKIGLCSGPSTRVEDPDGPHEMLSLGSVLNSSHWL